MYIYTCQELATYLPPPVNHAHSYMITRYNW